MRKIAYLSTCFSNSHGGHFYSLRSIAEELKKEFDIHILTVGTSISPVLCKMHNYKSIKSRFPTPHTFWSILRYAKKNEIRIIHSFDKPSYLFARIVSLFSGIKVLHTKCGGPSPASYYPKMNHLVLFSVENMRFFKNSLYHRKTELFLIPNRVSEIPQDFEAIDQLKNRFRKETKIILRISRFSEQHKKSILDSITLVKLLRKDNVDVQLLILGMIQDREVYTEIINHIDDNVLVVTEKFFTVNASRVLDVADIVVGTGRGVMEAALKGKLVLCPVKNLRIPVLLSEDNIHTFLEFNFSARTEILNISEEIEYSNLKQLLLEDHNISFKRSFIYNFAQEYYNVSNARYNYIKIYSKCLKCNFDIKDITLHFYNTVKTFLKSYYN